MTVVKNPRGRAMAAKTRRQAARLAADLEAELALNDNLDPQWESEAEEALTDLRSRFSTLQDDDAYTAGPSSLSSGAKKNLSGVPESDEVRSEGRRRSTTKKGGSGGQGAPRSPRAGRRGRPARRSRSSAFLGSAFTQTGIPGAGKSTSRFMLETLGLMIGLALLFLVLTDSERAGKGASVVEMVAGGVTSFVHLVIAPVDPLNASARESVTRATGAQSGTVTTSAGSTPASQVQAATRHVREQSRPGPLVPESPLRLP